MEGIFWDTDAFKGLLNETFLTFTSDMVIRDYKKAFNLNDDLYIYKILISESICLFFHSNGWKCMLIKS